MIMRLVDKSKEVKEPVRVCVFVDNMRSAGTEMRLRRLIESYDREKVIPYLCLLDGENESSKNLEPENCEVLRLGVRKILRWSTVGRLRTLYKFLTKNRIDVIELYFRDCTAVGTPIGRLAGAKCVTTFFSLGYWLNWIDRLIFLAYRPLISGTIANCDAASKAAQKIAFASPTRSVVLPNGIELDKFKTMTTENLFRSEKVKIGMVANLRSVKNPMMMVDAAKLVVDKGHRVEFSIVGDGPMRDSLQSAISSNQLNDFFRLPGKRNDVENYLAEQDICVLCSHSEGMSNALAEYMAAGRAVIATAVGGNTELIEHEQNGLLVEPSNSTELAESIIRLVENPDFARSLAVQAQSKARNEFSIESMTRRFEAYYECLNQNKRVTN